VRNLLTNTAIVAVIGTLCSVGCGGGNVDGISSGGAGGSGAGSLDASTGGTAGGGGAGGAGAADGAICRAAGSACTSPLECCALVCEAGTCGGAQCTSDNQPCTSSTQCCSGTCGAGGTCAPLNPACRTNGNACSAHADCCSKLCSGGVCANGSFCTQNGDTCAANSECCGGLCAKTQGAAIGVCGQPSVPGATGCAVAGQACGGGVVSDGGSGGVPECGGECCSRACAPHRSGLLVCQPPSGCRPTGEICSTDADCCGFGGIQGQTGTGSCNKANATDPVGRCGNGNSCRPAGAVCKLASLSCNAENNCCSGQVQQNPFACQQDILGIPRCTMLGQPCNDGGSKAGQSCASSADCCGLACVPNPAFTADAGMPPFVCGGQCAGSGGTCTTAADCCPGLPCTMPPGSTRGTCGFPPSGDAGPPPPVDGSSTDAEIPDVWSDGGKPICAEYGQVCTTGADCCNSVPCTNGRCIYIVK
jgi:hypothetical protein